MGLLDDPRTYRFSTSFTLERPRAPVSEVLLDLEHYVDWWPQVRAVAKLDDDHALVVCRSTLPYDLELVLSAESREPPRLEVGIDGPIRGWARFTLTETAPSRTAVEFEQQVRAERPLLVLASYAAKPLLVWNHEQMMRGLVTGVTEQVSRRPIS